MQNHPLPITWSGGGTGVCTSHRRHGVGDLGPGHGSCPRRRNSHRCRRFRPWSRRYGATTATVATVPSIWVRGRSSPVWVTGGAGQPARLRHPGRTGQGQHGGAPTPLVARRQCHTAARFAGTFHVNDMEPIDAAYSQAAGWRRLPDPLPCSLPPFADRPGASCPPGCAMPASDADGVRLAHRTRCSATPKA